MTGSRRKCSRGCWAAAAHGMNGWNGPATLTLATRSWKAGVRYVRESGLVKRLRGAGQRWAQVRVDPGRMGSSRQHTDLTPPTGTGTSRQRERAARARAGRGGAAAAPRHAVPDSASLPARGVPGARARLAWRTCQSRPAVLARSGSAAHATSAPHLKRMLSLHPEARPGAPCEGGAL